MKNNKYSTWGKTVAVSLVFLSLLEFTPHITEVRALAPRLVSQIPAAKCRIFAAALQKRGRIIPAESEKQVDLLKKYHTNALFLPDSQKYLVSRDVAEDNVKLTGAIVHADTRAFMRILREKDPFRYENIRDQIYANPRIRRSYHDLCRKEGTAAFHLNGYPEDLTVDDIVAKAVEIMFIVENDFVADAGKDFEEQEKRARFYLSMRPVIEGSGGYAFFKTGLFAFEKNASELKGLIDVPRTDRPAASENRETTNSIPFRPLTGSESEKDMAEISELFDGKELSGPSISRVRNILLNRYIPEGVSADDTLVDNAIRVAHKLYVNPSRRTKDICEELEISLNDMLATYSLIRRISIFHDLFLRTSSYRKVFSNIIYLLDRSERIEKIISEGRVYPEQVEIHLSRSCQRKCPFCWSKGLGYDRMPGRPLEKEQVLKMIDAIKEEGGDTIMFSGGKEPTKYPFLAEVMEHAHGRGLNIELITNGIELDDKTASVLMSAERVKFSLDAATPRIYSRNSGFKEEAGRKIFEKVKNNVRRLVELKHRNGSSVRIGISLVISRDNCGEILDFLDLGRELEVDFIIVNHDYETMFDGLSKEQLSGLSEIAENIEHNIRTGKYGKCVVTLSELLSRYVRKKYSEPLIKPGLCRALWRKIAVDPHGNFYPCCYWVQPGPEWKEARIVGNIRENTYKEIVEKIRKLKIAPDQCPCCPEHEKYSNIILAKLKEDSEYGVPLSEQPFVSLREYTAGLCARETSSMEALRLIYNEFNFQPFSFSKLVKHGMPVSRRNVEILAELGLIKSVEGSRGQYKVSDTLKGQTPEKTERNIASIYNIKLVSGGRELPLSSYRIPEDRIPFIKERIKIELAHVSFVRALETADRDRPGEIKIWNGYVSLSQQSMRTAIEKLTRKGPYQVDFEDLDDLVDFACAKGAQNNAVTILPHSLLTGDQRKRINETGARVIYMDVEKAKDLGPFSRTQLEGIIAAGVAYLNDNDFALMNLYKILTDEGKNIDIGIEQLKRNPGMLIFVLKPASIRDYDDLRHLNERMEGFLFSA